MTGSIESFWKQSTPTPIVPGGSIASILVYPGRGHFGVQVGRIFDRVPGASAPRDATWCWSVDTNYRLDPRGLGVGGNAATREDAMIAFRGAWDVVRG